MLTGIKNNKIDILKSPIGVFQNLVVRIIRELSMVGKFSLNHKTKNNRIPIKTKMMKTQIISTTIIFFSLLFMACENTETIIPNDNIITQQHFYSDYDRIETEGAFTVYVEFSDTEESIEIEANDNLHQYIEVKKEGSALKIGFRDNINITGSATLVAHVTTKKVTDYAASGASQFFINELSAEDVSIFLSGASQFSGEVYVMNLSAELSGASVVHLLGEAETTDFTASGASIIGGFEYSTEILNVNFSGASMLSITVNDELDVTASGASIISYKGTGVVKSQNLSGESKIFKVD